MLFLGFCKKILELKSVKVAGREMHTNHYPWRQQSLSFRSSRNACPPSVGRACPPRAWLNEL